MLICSICSVVLGDSWGSLHVYLTIVAVGLLWTLLRLDCCRRSCGGIAVLSAAELASNPQSDVSSGEIHFV